MESQKTLLYVSLFLIILLLWNAWEADHYQKTAAATASVQTTSSGNQHAPIPMPASTGNTPMPATSQGAKMRELVMNKSQVIPANRIIHISNDVLNLEIDALGGRIVNAKLKKYPESVHSTQSVTLLDYDPSKMYIATSGIIASHSQQNTTGLIFSAVNNQNKMPITAEQMQVTLRAQLKGNIVVDKVFTLYRDRYVMDVQYFVHNNSQHPFTGYMYNEIARNKPVSKHGSLATVTYTGAAISSAAEPYQKISFKNMEASNLSQNIKGGWASMIQHYFLSVWVPEQEQTSHFYTHAVSGLYAVGFASPEFTVAPGAKKELGAKFYVGPAVMERLDKVAPNLKLAVDYGHFWIISAPIFWLMSKIYSVVGNWGWAIIFVTLFIKLLFYKLSESSYRSMARMRDLQPKLEDLKKRFGDDKQKMTQATMELYKKEKVNPFGGCLALLPQIPVFLSLYWVLVESVQLRQAPFIFWLQDLSIKDPYYVLPVLMGASMVLQQKMSPTPPDPMQAKVMMFMPVMFTVLFLNFPSGLVLYWLTNNGLSILQQWWIMRSLSKKKSPKLKTQKQNG